MYEEGEKSYKDFIIRSRGAKRKTFFFIRRSANVICRFKICCIGKQVILVFSRDVQWD